MGTGRRMTEQNTQCPSLASACTYTCTYVHILHKHMQEKVVRMKKGRKERREGGRKGQPYQRYLSLFNI